jgi:hypothetical protein
VTSTVQGPGVEAILANLTRDITRLPFGKALTIAEFAVPGVTIWRVRPDSSGIPRVRYWGYDWSALRARDPLGEERVLDLVRPEDDALIAIARTGQDQPADPANGAGQGELDADLAYRIARARYPQAHAFRTAAVVDDLLGEATARVPLPPSLWYELVVARRCPSGRLELTAQPLFLPAARRGEIRPFTVRCPVSDEQGVAFAVVARDAMLSFELVSMASAQIPPGTYAVTATLLRPGVVRFDGLPARLRADSRSWTDIQEALPESLDVIAPAHLIVAVERCGTADAVRTRVDRAAQLIDQVVGASETTTCSLLTYASHSYERWTPDEPVTVLAWQVTSASLMESRLRALYSRDPEPTPYSGAAQVECMLSEVARRLGAPDASAAGRPVLVTIGNGRAFPHRVDPRTGIIPCPGRNNWSALLRGLADDHPGMGFGVIRDRSAKDGEGRTDPAEDMWRQLGANGSASLGLFDARRFAIELGVTSAAVQHLPLPLAVTEGAD